MIYLSLAALGVAAVTAIVLGQLLRVVIRQGARERELLVNQVCHLARNPWAPAPAEEYEVPEEMLSLVTSPEQEPDW